MPLVFAAASASLDRFLQVDALIPGRIHRPHRVVEVAGGKALNAARAARCLGAEVHVVALLGGQTGDWIRAELTASGFSATWVETTSANRICTSVGDDHGQLTEFYEPTPRVARTEWQDFVEAVTFGVQGSRWIALSGSLPPNMAVTGVRDLAHAAGRADVPLAVDLRNEALAAALSAGVDIVKVNASEAREALGSQAGAVGLAMQLQKQLRGPLELAIVTDGRRGAALASGDGVWTADTGPAGSWAVGSGDAFFGTFLADLARGREPPEALRSGVAAGAANTLKPGAGMFDLGVQERLKEQTKAVVVHPVTENGR